MAKALQVEQPDARQVPHTRVDAAGHRQVDDHQRRAGPPGHGLAQLAGAEQRSLHRRARHHQVRRRKAGDQPVQTERPSRVACQPLRALLAAAAHQQDRAGQAGPLGHGGGDLAGANDQDGPPAEPTEDGSAGVNRGVPE